MTKKIVPKQQTSMALAFEDQADAGFEDMTSRDIIVPRLAILQALSPQLMKSKAEYIPGAQASDICDVSTGKTWPGDEGILFLPVHYSPVVVEWAPRDSGRGLVAIHTDLMMLDRYERDDEGKIRNEAGNLLQETRQFWGFNLSDNAAPCFIPMARTQLKHGRRWIDRAAKERVERSDGTFFRPALFYRTWELKTFEESNAEGTWYSWLIKPSVKLSERDDATQLFESAKAFRDAIKLGSAKADLAEEDADDGKF